MGQLSINDMGAIVTRKNKVSKGKIFVSGSKHIFIYAFLFSIFQNQTIVELKNVPDISDTTFLVEYAKFAGAEIDYDKNEKKILIRKGITRNRICTPYILNCRSSLIALTLHFLKFSNVSILNSFGGCKIGERKIDQHIKLWKELGAEIYINDCIILRGTSQKKINVFSFDIDTTMGSVAALFALANGKITKINNISIRPEIIELINFLSLFGYVFSFQNKVLLLKETNISDQAILEYVIPDDIDECLGWACFCDANHINAEIIAHIPYIDAVKFLEEQSDGSIKWSRDAVFVQGSRKKKQESCVIEASEFPAIGSDQQPVFSVWSSLIYETVYVKDKKFPLRFNYLDQLLQHGWHFERINGFHAVQFASAKKRQNPSLCATDIRAGFAYLLAGSVLYDEFTIKNYEQLLRGYSDLNEKLNSLGFAVETFDNSPHESVAILVTDVKGQLYLQKRDDNAIKNAGLISFFGGAVEQGETPKQAAERELKEELSLDVPLHLVGEYKLHKNLYSMSGTVYLYKIEIVNPITDCNEGNLIVRSLRDASNENLTMFARCILEMLEYDSKRI